MAKILTDEEFQRVRGRDFKNDAELTAALDGSETAIARETLATLGAGYRIGNVELPPMLLGTVKLLELIDSPFLDENAEDVGMSDIMRSVYVLAVGREAVRPIMAQNRRRAAIEAQKPMGSLSPEHFAVYLAAIDTVEQGWAEFEDQAAAFWEHVGPVALAEVATTLTQMIQDAFSGFAAVPAGKSQKKTVSSTP